MAALGQVLVPALVFLAMVTLIAFVHELGHFLAARRCGVRVEVFSVGFGRELFGHTDSRGTRWRFALLPLGGYVKMFAENGRVRLADGGSRPVSASERAESYGCKSVGARAAIVFAGPLANIVFAVLLLAGVALATGHASGLGALGYGVERALAFAAGNLETIAGLVAGETAAADVVGPVCESGDTFAGGRLLPALAPGELVAILDAGAYGAVMSSTYNARPLAAAVMVRAGEVAVIRQRQTIEALIAQDVIPRWLASG